jgi:heme/copper-type cytochrome/quinol oxidase subunit 2
MVLTSTLALGHDPKRGAPIRDEDAQVIQMTAKKYEFSPSHVHLKQGIRVQLKITALDRDHGFKCAVVPDGAYPSGFLGLEFTWPRGNEGWKLKKGKETTIEFFATTPGTYEFSCSVACGIHHGRMKGQLVVDP